MKVRMGFIGALCALVTGLVFAAQPATAGGPRASILMPKGVYVNDVNENSVGTGSDGQFVARFDLSAKKPRVQRVHGVYGMGWKVNAAGYVLANVITRNGNYGSSAVLTGTTLESAWFLPGQFYPATIADTNVVVGTTEDFFRGTYYPVRLNPTTQTIEVWDENLPNAWVVDADKGGNTLVQIDTKYDENGNIVADPMILMWEANGNVWGIGNGYASAISPNGRYVVAYHNGPVRFDLSQFVDSVVQETALPILEGATADSSNAVDVNDFGHAVGACGQKPAMWISTPSAITLGNGGPTLTAETVTDLTQTVDIPRGYTPGLATKITNTGGLIINVIRPISRRKVDFRTLYVPPVVKTIDLPRPLQ